MTVTPEIQRILSDCPELELSVDLEPGSNGDGPAPAPLPLVAHDHVIRQEAGPPDIVASPATETTARETPPPRRRKRAAPTESGNGNGELNLASVFLTIPQVAALFHMHPGSVWRLVCEGRLPAVKLGTRLLIPAEAVTAFIAARHVQPKAWARRTKETPGEA